MKDIFKSFLKYIITFFCLIALFNVLLYLSCSFPSSLLEKHVKESAKIIGEEGDYPSRGFFAAVENITDGLQVNQIYSVDSEDPINSYLLVRKNYKKGLTKVVLPDAQGPLLSYSEDIYDEDGNPQHDTPIIKEIAGYETYSDYKIISELNNFVDGKVTISQTYSRYYHGHLTLFRPLFLLFNITGVRTVMSIVLITILVISTALIYKKIDFRFAIFFVTLLVLYGYFSTSQSLQQSPLLLVTMVSILVLLLNIEKYTKEKFTYHIFITGCFACYYDFLTVPVLSLALPLIVFYAYNLKDNVANLSLEKFKNIFVELVKFGFAWSVGFVCTWFTKFIIMDLVYNSNEIILGIEQIIYRTAGTIPNMEFFFEKGVKPHFAKTTLMSIVSCVLICLLFDKIKFYKPRKRDLQKQLSLILIGCIPLAWMVVIYSHSLYHYTQFTYRNVVVFLIAMFYIITEDNLKKKNKKR